MPETTSQKVSNALPVTGAGQSGHLQALLYRSGLAPATHWNWIQVTGTDRVRWLNGMVSNSIQQVALGSGCYNFILSAQGRIQGDAYAFAEPDQILLRTGKEQAPALTALLNRFIIMDDVELSNVPDDWKGLQLVGPAAMSMCAAMGLPSELVTPGIARVPWQSGNLLLVSLHAPLVPRLELWGEAHLIEEVDTALVQAGAERVQDLALEQLRLLEGTPRYGVDISDRDLPQETGQVNALHFAKGCYIGQEIVERIRSRGNVNRLLTGLRLEGAVNSSDRQLSFQGKSAGELTSVCELHLPDSPNESTWLALGYVRREFLEKGVELAFGQGGRAIPVHLPYGPAQEAISTFLKEGQHA